MATGISFGCLHPVLHFVGFCTLTTSILLSQKGDVIGVGAQGTVYLGLDLCTGRFMAVSVPTSFKRLSSVLDTSCSYIQIQLFFFHSLVPAPLFCEPGETGGLACSAGITCNHSPFSLCTSPIFPSAASSACALVALSL